MKDGLINFEKENSPIFKSKPSHSVQSSFTICILYQSINSVTIYNTIFDSAAYCKTVKTVRTWTKLNQGLDDQIHFLS